MSNDVVCTALEQDWGDDRPNILMHPPCDCPRCAPVPKADADTASWLKLPGHTQRFRVEPATLGAVGNEALG